VLADPTGWGSPIEAAPRPRSGSRAGGIG
jgi:hypothetical protein